MYQVTIQFKSQRNTLEINVDNNHIKNFINAIENQRLYNFNEEISYFFNINEIEHMIVSKIIDKKSNVIKEESNEVIDDKNEVVKDVQKSNKKK